MSHKNFIVTYTTQHGKEYLGDDFVVVEILTHNEYDANIVMDNIEKIFDGVVIECAEEEHPRQKNKKRKVNSDRRKKV